MIFLFLLFFSFLVGLAKDLSVLLIFSKNQLLAPTGVAQLVGHNPTHTKRLPFDFQSGHMLRLGHVQNTTDQCFFLSLPHFLSRFPPLKNQK